MISSYFLYIFTVLLAVLFAFFAQKYKKENKQKKIVPNYFFMLSSMLPLIFIMGFRDISVGVDGYNYFFNYNSAASMSISQYYSENVTEPGFYLLYRIAYFLGDVQWLFIISACITIYFLYQSLSYEVNRINLPLAVFIFATTQYFYYFGIMRMGIAVAIIAFAYRFIIEGNKKKFIIYVFLATLFHYSALFAAVLLFFSLNERNSFRKTNLIKLALIIPIGFLFVKYFIFPFITAARYQGYVESSGVIGTGFINSLPFLLLFLLYYNQFSKSSKHYQFYFYLFIVKVITETFAPIIGIGRMVWYSNMSLCFMLPFVIRLNHDRGVKVILFILTILYCIVYSYFAYFGSSDRGEVMLPYKNVFFEFFE